MQNVVLQAQVDKRSPSAPELQHIYNFPRQSPAKQVIEAKEHILELERTYFFTCFPKELILKLELENPNQRRECFEEAIRQLPKILPYDEKLQIVGMCLGAGLCNDQLGFREFSIIELTATSLDLTTEELVSYIAFMLDDSPDALKALPFFDDDISKST